MNVSDSQILKAVSRFGSQRKAAAALGVHSRTVERRLARMAEPATEPRLLVIDIETAPNLAWVWGLFKQNIGINQIEKPGRVLCFAARWHGTDETLFFSEHKHGRERMVREAHKLMREADGVVGWNSQRFDTRWLNSEFRQARMSRPAGYRQVDLMREVKKTQYLPSYKLDFSVRMLGVGGKVETGGFELWRDCMNGDKEAWKLMEEYNRHDTELTDALLTDMRHGGWIASLPNLSVDGGDVCPCCGGDRLRAEGYVTTKTRRYRRWVCLDCGTTSQAVKSEPGGARLKATA